MAALPVPTFAQTVPPAPPQGSLPTAQQVTPPPPQGAPAAQVSVDARGAIVQRPCPFDNSPLRINLASVEFVRPDGSPLQPEIAEALSGVLRPTGDLPVKTICEIRDAANEALRAGHWVASVGSREPIRRAARWMCGGIDLASPASAWSSSSRS